MQKATTSERLRQLMAERHLKQIDILNMAKPYCKKYDIKLGRNDISQYVSGKNEPGQYKLYILGEALGVNEAWLLGFDVPMERQNKSQKEKSPENADDLLNKTIKILSHLDKDTLKRAYAYLEVLAFRDSQEK